MGSKQQHVFGGVVDMKIVLGVLLCILLILIIALVGTGLYMMIREIREDLK